MNNRLNASARLVLFWAPALLLAGCASDGSMQRYVPQIVTPYRMDIQQGNFVTQEMVDKLAVGQTRDQVRFILGTPLLVDVFHANRWDYVFRLSRGWNEPERRRLVIYFDADSRVSKWDADVPAPTPAPAAAGTPEKPGPAAPVTVPVGASATPAASPGDAAPANASGSASTALPVIVAAAPQIVQDAAPQPVQASPASAAASAPPPVMATPVPAVAEQAKPDVVPAAPAVLAPPAAPAIAQPPAALADIDRKLASAPVGAQVSANAAPRDVLTALEQWRAAWSARDIDGYLSMYAPTFKPSGGLTRARWEQQRRERIGRASFVVVKVVDPQVTVAGSDAAAIFTQVYESDTLKESGRKKLALVLVGDGKWRIREEAFEK